MKSLFSCLFLFVVCAAASLSAHPAGSTAVSIVVRADSAVDLLITAEAQPLLSKLEALAMMPATSETSRDARARRLGELRETLLAHVELRVDDAPVALAWQDATIDDAGVASVRLTSRVPETARTMTWKTSLIFGSYPLGVSRQRGEETLVWVAGAASSGRLRLDDLPASMNAAGVVWMGVTHILPNGIDHSGCFCSRAAGGTFSFRSARSRPRIRSPWASGCLASSRCRPASSNR